MAAERSSLKRKHADEMLNTNTSDEHMEDMNLSDDEGTVVDGIYIPPAIKPACTFDPNGPRLVITKIENNFFKSYANNQVLGPFHKCFNAIVGPNGSGKSNVIDSMLFVFGYRASKIRSKNTSVLLHNSENYRNVQSCTVSVHFALIVDKEGDEYDIVPESEFVVSRTANKDNSSYYTLNGRKVQFKEVGKLLKQHGIDLDHNRFLILQGEVEQISMMKCKAENEHETGMLEYLEDIIGTTRYKKPLEELNERVEILAEQRNEKLNRLKLVENELEGLRGPMEEAVGFLKTENIVVNCKNFIYQRNIFDLQMSLTKLEEEKSCINDVHQGLVDKINELKAEKAEKDKILQQETEKYESLQKRKETLKQAFDKANTKDIQLQETMSEMNKNRKKTKELLEGEIKHLSKLELIPEQSKKTIDEYEAKSEELTEKKKKLEENKVELLASIRTETKGLQEKKEILQTDLVVLQRAVDESKAAYSLSESELKLFISNEENELTKLENLRTELDNTKKNIVNRTEILKELKTKIPATEKSLNLTTIDLNSVKNQENELIKTLRQKRSYLEETRSSMQASKSRGRVLDSLMQQKRDGNCDGLFGRLGDLGAIDLKYDVAISTACGPLDNIVVDTVETAQWCIEFLKEYNIGHATFIALEKQEHFRNQAESLIKTPKNVPRLFDLIKIQDARVKTAFYYALRDTLVANDLEQASEIAYGAKRFRVVTLGGELIETTGTMSGGGKTVSKGRMGQAVATQNVDPKQFEQLQIELSQLEESVREFRQRQLTLEDQVNTLQPQLREMKINNEKFTMELRVLQQQYPLLEKQLKEQEIKAKNSKANEKEVNRLTKIVDTTKLAYDKALEKAGKLQIEVDKITKEINDKSAGKMQAIQKNINDISKNIDKLQSDITKLRVGIKTAERNSIKTAEKIKTMQADIKNMETRLYEMKDERTEIESDAKKLLECIDDITKSLTEGEEHYSGTKIEVEKLTNKENKLKSEKVDVDQKLKVIGKKINDCNANLHQWEVKISHLKLQEIPNDSAQQSLKKFSTEELETRNLESVQNELQSAESYLKAAKPNLNAIHEYKDKQNVFIKRSDELEAVTEKRNQIRKLFDDLRTKRKEEFLKGYGIIKLKLKEMYQMITLEGDADFEMVDSFDPFTEGIQLNVRPPKKSWKRISNLSGGEKTLSSLALVFALHYYKPSPLYVMDEIDAALDFKNVSIIGYYIKERTKNAQFIIISLRSNMFELSDNLIGIYKTFNCTKCVTIDPRKFDNPGNKDQVVPQNEKEKPTQQNNQVISSIVEPSSESIVLETSEDDMSVVGLK